MASQWIILLDAVVLFDMLDEKESCNEIVKELDIYFWIEFNLVKRH